MVIHKNSDLLDNHYKNLAWTNPAGFYKLREEIGNPVVNVSKKNKHRRNNSPISHKEAKKIAKRLDKGEFAKDICKEYNVSEMSISRIRKRYCKNKQASPRYAKNIKETVLKLARKHPSGEVARITGIKYHTVYRWLKAQQR
jgi:DNA invertase Pin-like site-specific DNA recombinase